MRQTMWIALLLLASTVLFVSSGDDIYAQDGGKRPNPGNSGYSKTTYAVVDNGEELSVVESSAIPALKKELAAAHKQALKEHSEAKREAAKAKKKFTEKPPAKRTLKIVAQRLPTKEAAENALEKEAAARLKKSGGFAVVSVAGEYRVIRKSEFASVKRAADKDHAAAVAEWNEASKTARKAKQKFTEKKPTRPVVKILKAGFPSEESAQSELEKIQEKSSGRRGGKQRE